MIKKNADKAAKEIFTFIKTIKDPQTSFKGLNEKCIANIIIKHFK